METTIVTTNMLYEFLKEFKTEVYNRFEQMDKRFEQVDNRFEQLEKRMDRLENQQLDDRKMLMEVWQSRDRITVNFSRTFTIVNAFISGIVATFVAAFVKK
jgi:predicted nuclease with TOPRIM domain